MAEGAPVVGQAMLPADAKKFAPPPQVPAVGIVIHIYLMELPRTSEPVGAVTLNRAGTFLCSSSGNP